jgi:hypothetical protein
LSCFPVLAALDRGESTARPTIFGGGRGRPSGYNETATIERSPDITGIQTKKLVRQNMSASTRRATFT